MRPIERVLAVCCIGVFAAVSFSASHAAEITVSPGSGTLAAAISSATSGDTLILQDGVYSGDVIINRSLTIRPSSRSVQAVVSDTVTVNGTGITVTLQGLEFRKDLQIQEASSTRILENHWPTNGIQAAFYVASSPVIGSLVIIGNTFSGAGSIFFSGNNAYVAGNVISNGGIYHTANTPGNAWIIGNHVSNLVNSTAIGLSGAGGWFIGNRVKCVATSNYCITVGGGGLHTSAVLLNNIVLSQVSTNTGLSVLFINASGSAVVRNNILSCSGPSLSRPMFNAQDWQSIQGNVILNDGCRSDSYLDFMSPDVSYNLCAGLVCPEDLGNLNADPQFLDLVDFRLGPGSPAIDAGPPDVEYADLDRTRNDMGPRGGSWNIDQFDPQRDPNNLAPYVYPIVTRNSPAVGDEFELRAIGAAKLR